MATGFTVRIRIRGANETLNAFRDLPKDASRELRERTLNISRELAGRIQAAAKGDSGQAALMAPTVRARRDRVPSVTAGGTKRVGSNKVPAYKILFGSEFGANSEFRNHGGPMNQFRPHRGRQGYWFFPTVEGNAEWIERQWLLVADAIVNDWGRG